MHASAPHQQQDAKQAVHDRGDYRLLLQCLQAEQDVCQHSEGAETEWKALISNDEAAAFLATKPVLSPPSSVLPPNNPPKQTAILFFCSVERLPLVIGPVSNTVLYVQEERDDRGVLASADSIARDEPQLRAVLEEDVACRLRRVDPNSVCNSQHNSPINSSIRNGMQGNGTSNDSAVTVCDDCARRSRDLKLLNQCHHIAHTHTPNRNQSTNLKHNSTTTQTQPPLPPPPRT